MSIFRQLRKINKKLSVLQQQGETAMSAFSDAFDALKAKVDQQITVANSAITLLQGLNQMLKDAIASQDPQQVIDLSAKIDAETQALTDAITSNTPTPTPPPTPTPTP